MTFRKDINGLRAIAVLTVVIFHFEPNWLPGGFVGVDVFFVISGFLMTGIIFRGLEKANFSILSFYVARANRIIPALAVLCITMLVLGWMILTPNEYSTLATHVASSISFVSNIVYWSEAGYFDAASKEKWLLHTWSLSAEWQFYILYPLVLLALNRLMSLKSIKQLICIATVLGFCFAVIASIKWPNPSYYLLPTRAWEMLLGGCAFLFPLSLSPQMRPWLERIGLSLILLSSFLLDEHIPWPGYWAFLPTFGAFLLIQAQRQDSWLTANPLSQKLGLWSYSIYLWHWPLVVMIYHFSLGQTYVYLAILLSVGLGWLSYELVERRSLKKITSWFGLFTIKPVLMSAALVLLCSIVYFDDGLAHSWRRGASTPQAKFILYYQDNNTIAKRYDAAWLKCNTYLALRDSSTLETDPSCVTSRGEGGVFLWGDSHAEALSLGLRTALSEKGVPFYQKTSSGCRASLKPLPQETEMAKRACDYSNKYALDSIANLKPDVVVIAQRNQHDQTDWLSLVQHLKNLGVGEVIVVGPTPQWSPSLPRVLTKPIHWQKDDLYIADKGFDTPVYDTDLVMRKRQGNNDLYYVSLLDSLCYEQEDELFCRARFEGGAIIARDYGHLSEQGSVYVANNILVPALSKVLN
ncbi:acyltransferase family protein [Agaribacterium haliotis]|uniref:acyltransferase family protein n=1 Tax=Agaribacterium haliotis TaxID=2013869 RepID=UPI000BB5678A|nr:acyltransferase family protein [Agaribacterium haliotis]